MNGGNKLALAINLIGESGIDIEFMYWDERFLSDYRNEDNCVFVYWESDDSEFCIYSHEKGYIIDEGQFALVVPDAEFMKTGFRLKHTFVSDDVRHDFLKTMLEYLPEWASGWDSFKHDKEATHDFLIHQQYWVY